MGSHDLRNPFGSDLKAYILEATGTWYVGIILGILRNHCHEQAYPRSGSFRPICWAIHILLDL